MPFWTSEDDHSYPPDIRLESISPTEFRLLTPFTYQPLDDTALVNVVAFDPAHGDPDSPVGKTDLASVPPLLWGLLPSYGRQLRAALLHDQLCTAADDLKKTNRSQAYRDRRRADGLFQMSMRDPGDGSPADIRKRVAWARSWIFYAGVSYGRYWGFRKLRAVLMTLQVVVAVLATYLAIPGMPRGPFRHWLPFQLGTHWYGYLLVLLAVFLLSGVWGRDWRAPFVGAWVGPIVLPVLVVTFICGRLLGLPDWVASKLPTQPPARWSPSFRKP